MNPPLPSIVRLPDVRLLSVAGSDATRFLQAQLSRRVDNLSPDSSAVAGWHDASGKVRAVFRVITADDGYLLCLPADLAHKLAATLKMFVLRADVTVELTNLICAGLVTDGAQAPVDSQNPALPPLPSNVNAVTRRNEVCAICIAPACWHFIGPESALGAATDGDSAVVTAAEIRAGLPQVDQNTTQRYIAQMLNLEKLDAIDFEKGCYPGQEIIARTEHLGTVKRRAQLFSLPAADAPPAAPGSGAVLVSSNDERVGEILRCARDADGSLVMLGVVALSALSDTIFLENSHGPALTHHPLPFLSDQ
jgi:folate-binding protein YgfZ